MLIREMDDNNDMQFGRSMQDFIQDSPEAIVQLLRTRLKLWQGEWFANINDGTPWAQDVLGNRKAGLFHEAIRGRVLSTYGVKNIIQYSGRVKNRRLHVEMVIDTIYGKGKLVFGEREV